LLLSKPANAKKETGQMKNTLITVIVLATLSGSLLGQSGSINNTLGSGGSFTVKNSAGDPLMVVDEATGQLTADRVKVDGVPSFTAYHLAETGMSGSHTLVNWSEATGYGTHDNSGSFNTSTGEFVASRNGFYFFSAGIELAASGSGVTLYILANSSVTSLAMRGLLASGGANLSTSGILKLNASDVVTVRITITSLSGTGSTGLGWFSGYLVSDF
jgi:hypothetical protein